MSISANYNLSLSVVSTDAGDFVLPSNNSVSFAAPTTAGTLTASTTVPATKFSADSLPLVSGAKTIDFAALPGRSSEEVIVGTGLKCQIAYFGNPSTNLSAITITEGVANGLALMGATFKVTLLPGQAVLFFGNDAAPDIASGDRMIDLAGSGVEALDTFFVMG